MERVWKFPKIFSYKVYKLRNKCHTFSSSLRWDHFPLRSWPWKWLSNICLRFKNVPQIDFLELHGKQAKISKRRIKANNFLYLGWMQYMENWFGWWDATHLFHDASLHSCVHDTFLQHQCIDHDMGQMWRLMFHTLYYTFCT